MFRKQTWRVEGLAALATCVAGMAIGQEASQDAYPLGAIAYFNLQSCPAGWETASELAGFSLVPFAAVPPGMLGKTVNSPLAGGEARSHTHTLSSSISVPEVKYVGVVGGRNSDTSKDGTMKVTGGTDLVDAGIPYIQLLLCRKTAFQRAQNPPLGIPQTVAAFFETGDCPTGWKLTPVTSGRFLVGLPSGGMPEAAFGGPALSVGENRTHSHGFASAFTIPSTGVGLAAGCCAEHYGAQGTFQFQGSTDPAAAGFPYAIVTQCQPCVTGDEDPACQGQ